MKKEVKFYVHLSCLRKFYNRHCEPWNAVLESFDTYEEAENFILNDKIDLDDMSAVSYSIKKVWVIDE